MHRNITSVLEYKIHEYLLILSPTGEAARQIWSVKHEFNRTLNAPFAIHTGPHLTVIVFFGYQGDEKIILNRLQALGAGISPFDVVLQGYGCFNPSRTIYINVVTKDAVQNLMGELKQAKHLLKLNAGFAPKFANDPHITICRGMEPWQYDTGWSKYQNLSFDGNFTATGMTLLKRVPGEHACQHIAQFPFLSTSTMPKQSLLFV